jgi:hypothetical protein
MNVPPSSFNIGSNASPENTVGMPITTPENVEFPPRCIAYSLDDETMMKKEIYNGKWLDS